jgi:predicted O-linked N-acetylglucosamine transferase (SPINDLY family)
MKIALFDSGWEYNLNTPYEEPLGGIQSSICYFLEQMAINNHEVYLFNKNSINKKLRNVMHIEAINYLNFINNNKVVFDLIIVSCLPHDLFQLKITINNPNTLYCLWTGHDIDQNASKILKDTKAKDMIDLFIFVSNWQRNRYIENYNINYNKTLVMLNGIGKPFEKYLNLPLNKKKDSMTYCSIPWRGLDLIEPIFNKIKIINSNSSMKIFSGMNIYKQSDTSDYDNLKNIKDLSLNNGISQENLASELYNIEYLTYPNIFPETSCITVLQAMACGCLIITSNLGALKETMNNLNEYVDINIHNIDKDKYINEFVNRLNNIMNLNDNIKEMLIQKNKDYIKETYLWSVICNKFEKDISLYINNYNKYLLNEHNIILQSFIDNFNKQIWQNVYIDSLKINFYSNINEYLIIKLNLGVAYFQSGNLDEAKKCFKICKELKNDYEINKNIALLELQRNELLKFVKYARIALSFKFEIFLANLLAEKYELLGLYNDAIALYETIIYLEPTNINSYNNLGNLKLLQISQVDDIDIIIDKTYGQSLILSDKLGENRKKELILSNILFNNQYNWKLSNEEIFKRTCVWYNYFPKENKLINISDKLNRNKIINNRIRIGYISCDFITHPVGFMFESILKNHDINTFDIFCYDCCDTGKKIDDVTSKRLRKYNNATWRDICDINDEDALTIIVNDDLDILIDMMGHTRNTRMNLLQYKPARIIVSYFAYPATNGLKEIDYRITDKYASPPESQKFFLEKFYYMPNGFQCYTPPQDLDCTKDYTRNKYKIHLGCFNNPIKLSIPCINTFCEILKRLPESKLFLKYCYYKSSYYKETIYKLFTDRGIDRDRVDIGYEPILDAIKFYNKIDITLDSFPYAGGTISSECLYMSTPFITLAGTTYVSRVGVSLLSNLGLDKYIANTEEEYIQKTIDLARNESELKLLHQTIRIKFIQSELYDSKKFTKSIENAYCDMFNDYN